MCCCEKPNVNGTVGYQWQPKDSPGVHPRNPPDVPEGVNLIFDEPGRCGGQDSHPYHYRVTLGNRCSATLYVRHGGGDENMHISNGGLFVTALATLDSDARYWVLNALWHAHSHAASYARMSEKSKWVHAFAQKRIRKSGRKHVRVWIETPDTSRIEHCRENG